MEDLPYYDGFDKDVFIVVKDYFLSLEEPLTTFDMYDVFTNVMGKLHFCFCNKFNLKLLFDYTLILPYLKIDHELKLGIKNLKVTL